MVSKREEREAKKKKKYIMPIVCGLLIVLFIGFTGLSRGSKVNKVPEELEKKYIDCVDGCMYMRQLSFPDEEVKEDGSGENEGTFTKCKNVCFNIKIKGKEPPQIK